MANEELLTEFVSSISLYFQQGFAVRRSLKARIVDD
jgi:hypothetical protein